MKPGPAPRRAAANDGTCCFGYVRGDWALSEFPISESAGASESHGGAGRPYRLDHPALAGSAGRGLEGLGK